LCVRSGAGRAGQRTVIRRASAMSARMTAARRRPNVATASPDMDPARPFHHLAHPSTPVRMTPPSGSATPRSTLGSPLSSHALVRRPGGGDVAAGRRRRISLSEVEILPWLCCMTPAISLFGIYGLLCFSSIFCARLFDMVTAMITFASMLWVSNLAFSSLRGAYKLREAGEVDWNSLLEDLQNKDPTANDVMHIVLLPNYKESEPMLKETLENLGRSPMARSRTRVVLAMEAREGPQGREKADRLIAGTQHLFADVFATYHPENLPAEVAGKSSNTQWAYREALRHIGPILMQCDLSRVFVTVGDADTLWHPHYLSALTYQGLMMSAEERVWTIWQPPVLLMRNILSVPMMTQASSHATTIFEMAGLANQKFWPAFAYSTYSVTLALASHPEVDGWDADVIAEDHHMFCKCYFAALWDSAHSALSDGQKKQKVDTSMIRPQTVVQPIWLPAVCFLVESPDGYIASHWARFQQARRHSQGIVELGYVLLQYARLTRYTGFFELPFRTHGSILSIVFKMHTLHITSPGQGFAVVVGLLTRILPLVAKWILVGGFLELLSQQSIAEFAWRMVGEQWKGLSFAQVVMGAALGNLSSVAVLFSVCAYIVMLPQIDGRYYKPRFFLPRSEMTPVAEGDESSVQDSAANPDESDDPDAQKDKRDDGLPSFVLGPQTLCQKIVIFHNILFGTSVLGYPTLLVYAVIPGILAGWSLLRRGTQFDYVVAVKPE